MPLIEPASGHPQEMELEIISQLIDNTPTICDYVLQDLNEGKFAGRWGRPLIYKLSDQIINPELFCLNNSGSPFYRHTDCRLAQPHLAGQFGSRYVDYITLFTFELFIY